MPKIDIAIANYQPENIEDPGMAAFSNTYVRSIEDIGRQIVPILLWDSSE